MNGYNQIRKINRDHRHSIAVIIIAITLIAGYIAVNMTKVVLQDNILSISGLYAIKADIEEISDVSLKDSLPNDFTRVNGMDFFGRKYIGNFNSKDLGNLKVYVLNKEKPYLYITLNNKPYRQIIIAMKSKEETQALYERLLKLK